MRQPEGRGWLSQVMGWLLVRVNSVAVTGETSMHECLALLAVRVHPVQGPRASSALLGPTTVKAVIGSDSAQTVLNSLVRFKLHAILVAVLMFVLPFVKLQDGGIHCSVHPRCAGARPADGANV